jgi:hypothetical protein
MGAASNIYSTHEDQKRKFYKFLTNSSTPCNYQLSLLFGKIVSHMFLLDVLEYPVSGRRLRIPLKMSTQYVNMRPSTLSVADLLTLVEVTLLLVS